MTPLLQLSLFLLIVVQLQAQQNLYRLVLHSQERGGACLDGSPPGLYYHRGSGGNQNKFLIFFNSGDYCGGLTLESTLESCYQRSFGGLGSTKNAQPLADGDQGGIMSTKPAMNPVFHDWTKIFVIYCDGSEHTGSRPDPVSYKDRNLYFRGYNNTLEQFRYLDENFDFYNGEAIVITGVSAGGVAAYLYSNYLVEHTKSAKVYAIPDSGLFVTEYFSPFAGVQPIKAMSESLYKLVIYDGEGFPVRECIQEYDEYYHCYNAANLAKYLKAPMFIIESTYDQYSIDRIVVARCKSNARQPYSIANCNQTERAAIEDYRGLVIKAIEQIKMGRKDVGAWSPSCVQHGFTETPTFVDPRFQVPSVNGPTVSQAIAEFLANPQQAKMYIDQVPWPYNTACSGNAAILSRE